MNDSNEGFDKKPLEIQNSFTDSNALSIQIANEDQNSGVTFSTSSLEDSFKLLSREEMLKAISKSFQEISHDKQFLLTDSEAQLNYFESKFGECADFLALRAQLFRNRAETKLLYETLKKLYIDYPLSPQSADFNQLREELFSQKIEGLRNRWNKISNIPPSTKIAPNSANSKQVKEPEESNNIQVRSGAFDEISEIRSEYEEILAIDDMHVEALNGLALCFRDLNDSIQFQKTFQTLNEANEYWETCEKQRAQNIVPSIKKALQDGQLEEAINLIELGLQNSPQNLDLLTEKVEILLLKKNFQDSSVIVESVLKKYPNDNRFQKFKSEINHEKINETLVQGLQLLEEAGKKENEGRIRKAKIEKALELFYKVVNSDPDNIKAFEGIKRCHELGGRPDKARIADEMLSQIDSSYSAEITPDEQIFPEIEADFKILAKEEMLEKIAVMLQSNSPSLIQYIDYFEAKFGECPETLDYKAQIFQHQGKLYRSYEALKRLFYHYPAYLVNRNDYNKIIDQLFLENLEEAKSKWDKIANILYKSTAKVAKNTVAKSALSFVSGSRSKDVLGDLRVRDEVRRETEMILPLYTEILKVEPMHLDALKGLISCYRELDNLDLLKKTQEILPDAQAHWENLRAERLTKIQFEAEKAAQEEKPEKALDIINLGLDILPGNMSLLLTKTRFLKGLRKFKEAIACVDFLIKDFPNEPELEGLRRDIQAERLAEDLFLGNQALNEANQLVTNTNNKKPSKVQKAALQKALDFFYDALSIDENNLQAFEGIYRCHAISNRPDKAKKTLEHIQEVDKNYPVESLKSEAPVKASDCFIASRVLGPSHPNVTRLRDFRDNVLRRFLLGRVFVIGYQRLGPSLARLSPKSLIFIILQKTLKWMFD